ncbi:MAG: WG repeat-containing protein, partial [Bacteroidales bacterium]|nr:WG repeat-containing protein [Candidatus Colicola faecequi]
MMHCLMIVAELAFLAGIGYAGYSLYDYRHKQQYERELTDNISEVTYGGKTSIFNSHTGKTLIRSIEVEWIQEGRDSLAVFSKDKLRGYFNIHTGEVTVPAQYKHAWIFSEGLAGVVKDGMVGFINTRGEEVIPCRYPYHG